MRARLAVFAALAVVSVALSAPRAQAAVTPVADCMTPTATAGVYSVYFGYVNSGTQVSIPFGDSNQVVPGLGYQGQPEVFNVGSYPRVFRAIFNSNAFPGVSWELDGSSSLATTTTPLCAAGATGPASDVNTTGATLNGLVDPRATQTEYRFEYGETIAYGQTTPARQLTATSGELVSEPISGLEPATTYHYRLLASGSVATVGEDRTFTTAAAPPAPPAPSVADLALTRSGPRKARLGRTATITLGVTNRGPATATGVTLTARVANGLRIRSIDAGSGPCAGGRARQCNLGALAPGASAAVRLRLEPRRRGPLGYAASGVAEQPEASVADNLVDGTLRGR